VMDAVRGWRKDGLQAAYTIDAGPNVHVICLEEELQKVLERLGNLPGIGRVLTARVGGAARILK